MNAKEMRSIAKNAVKTEIESVNDFISQRAFKGGTQLIINDASQGLIAHLEDEGYEVENIQIESFTRIIVKW